MENVILSKKIKRIVCEQYGDHNIDKISKNNTQVLC